ncbi:MAG: hypothetical protein AMJ95_13015 [Omnitrophica WOR_2 bacterium SM23_72]|nr:MAG: hypothetical protein AMJ95_13015 [Omnitrophica WOR_2 bacterium SM23_72]
MYDLIIIGGGPAGLTAALYAGRYRFKTLLLEKMCLGGQIILSGTIENYPGFPGGISTQELMERFKKQIDELNIEIQMEEVTQISVAGGPAKPLYHVRTKEKSFETKAVIIATGALPKRLGIRGEDRLTGKGVSYCGTCDGPLFKGKDIMVIGGGDRAIEEAIFLAGYARSVTVVHRRDKLRASKILEEKAQAHPRIKFLMDSVVEEISGSNMVESVRIKNVKSDASSTLPCQGVFIFAGIVPNTTFLNNLLKLDDSGFIIADSDSRTSQPGIFACGDCLAKSLYQVVTACGEGALAAAGVMRYLS